jgi:hypothetical protein
MKLLVLSGTNVTDAGIVHLTGMTELTSLDLSFAAVTDETIERLRAFNKLKSIRLLGTGVTRQGVIRLRQAFPNADIDALPDLLDTPRYAR